MTDLRALYAQKIASGALVHDVEQATAVEALDVLANSLKKKRRVLGGNLPPHTQGAYLHGGVGRGKTALMDMFFASAPLQHKRRVHFHAFMIDVHDFLHAQRAKKKEKGMDDALIACAAHIAKIAKLLCFDEFQVQDVADAMILGRLFAALFDKGVTIVITSNTAPDELYADGLQRDRFLPFIALLKERLHILPFTGRTDYRMTGLKKASVYFSPADENATHELDKIFLALSGSDTGGPVVIKAKGRNIQIPRASKDTAMFSFRVLCEEPKSAVDYLEIVKNYKTLIMSDVPKLEGKGRDVALRFVNLIDTLYDAKARLIISAAAPPEELAGADAPPAMVRAISRLIEMQSTAW